MQPTGDRLYGKQYGTSLNRNSSQFKSIGKCQLL